MEMGESSRKDDSWIPTTPLKPILQTPNAASLDPNHVLTSNYNPQEPQGTSLVACQTGAYSGCCRKTISHSAPPTPDKAIGGESRQVVGMHIDLELDKEVPSTHSETPDNRQLSEAVMELSLAAASIPSQENHNLDKGGSHGVDLNQIPPAPKQRRRKHRPKVIKEGKPKRTGEPVTPKPDQSKENPTGRRKYVRKKGLNKAPATPPTQVTEESTEQSKENPTGRRKYVRKKGLNKASATPPTQVTGESTEQSKENPTGRRKYVRKKGLNKASATPPTQVTGESTEQSKENPTGRRKYVRKKGLNKAAATPPTQVTGESTEPVMRGSKKNSCRRSLNFELSQNDSNSSKSENLTTGLHLGGTKRQHSTTTVHADGVHSNELHACQICCVQFPSVPKKRRSEKGSSTTSLSPTKYICFATYPHEDDSTHLYTSSSKYLISNEYNPEKDTVTFEATGRATTHNISQATERSIDALAEKMHPSTKRKRTMRKNKNILVSSAHSSPNQMPWHHEFLLDGYNPSLAMSLDAAWQVPWNNMHIMDALTEKFRHLHINRRIRDILSQEQKALVTYSWQKQKDKTTQGVGTIIPYEGSFDRIRKRLPRPKVDLDEETGKMWKLLMLDINSHGIDGTNEDTTKFWEEERRVFHGRADSFIARMHLVQGDRRFSQWKGSVVDSVIGVFLTQNVSDHLSSSAFMSLAARFPLNASNTCKIYHEESTSLVVNEQVLMVEPKENTKWDDKILNQPVCCQSSPTKDMTNHSEKKALNSSDSPGTTSVMISLTDESNCKLLKSKEGNTREQQSSMSRPTATVITQEGQEKPCFGETRKELTDIVSLQCSDISSQISGDFSVDQNSEKIGSCSDSNSEVEDLPSRAKYNILGFSKLLEMVSSTKLYEVNSLRAKSSENFEKAFDLSIGVKHDNQSEDMEKSDAIQASIEESITPSSGYSLNLTTNSGVLEVHCFDSCKMEAPPNGFSDNNDENNLSKSSSQAKESVDHAAISQSESLPSHLHLHEQNNMMQQTLLHSSAQTQDLAQKATESNSGDQNYIVRNENTETNAAPIKPRGRKAGKDKKKQMDWDNLRIQAQVKEGKREKTADTMDSLDWDAVRRADVSEIADAIQERGMNNKLAERIQKFLNRLVEEHGSIDLEWLRDVPPDQAKEYLLSIRGLGLKSVECVRLLTLHHLAFPVDTNVGRIAVRLGWVPLQPLPESLQLHLLELYPVLESIQKYLWPRLCKLDQRTLYELHYQMITFGKVFCTKSKPSCNACPMRGECRHFASAFASARLALPGPEQRSIVSTTGNNGSDETPSVIIGKSPLPLLENTTSAFPESTTPDDENQQKQLDAKSDIVTCEPIIEEPATPIIEEPATPETECTQTLEHDIEDAFYEDTCEIPTIKLNIEEFTQNLQNYMQENMELQDEMSKALVPLTPEAASIPTPKLKNVSRLRTEHCVYELPDSHPLLEGWDKREHDDPCKYLLAIWTPGETASSIQTPETKCSFQEDGQLCNEKECFSCNSVREANSKIVRGTILIPCRTAMRGSFPLNGTYFQVNEVFADHDTSLDPINIPRSWIWNLKRRTVYFGTSTPSIFKGLSTQEIQHCFWRGYVCVRGFERETRAPRPLVARLHFPASKLAKTKEKKSSK